MCYLFRMTYHHKIVFLHQTDYSIMLFLSRRFCSSPLRIYSPKIVCLIFIRVCAQEAMEIQRCNILQVLFFLVAKVYEFFLLPSRKILFTLYRMLVVHKYFHYTTCLNFRHHASFHLIFAWSCIIDINNIDNQLDATITAY